MSAIFFLVLTACLLAAVPSIRRQMRLNEEIGRRQLAQMAAEDERGAAQAEINKRLLERMRKRDREAAEAEEKGFE